MMALASSVKSLMIYTQSFRHGTNIGQIGGRTVRQMDSNAISILIVLSARWRAIMQVTAACWLLFAYSWCCV